MKTKTTLRSPWTQIARKLPVFVFCVAFISGYNALFGRENSIVGVVLLMSLLMFLKADFGVAARYSGALIPALFVLMGLAARASVWNPWLGVAVNGAFLAGVLFATRLDVTHSCYLPFLMGYLMLRGYHVTGPLFAKRMLSLAVIGSLIGLLHWLCSRANTNQASLRALAAPLSRYGDWERWSLVLGVTLLAAMLCGDLLDVPKSMWVNLSVLSLITPLEEDLRVRRRLRIPATVLGCVLFLALFGTLIPPTYHSACMLLAGFLSMFITSYFIKTVYNSFSALVTATLMLPAKAAVLTRIFNNLIGAAVSMVSLLAFGQLFRRWDAAAKRPSSP